MGMARRESLQWGVAYFEGRGLQQGGAFQSGSLRLRGVANGGVSMQRRRSRGGALCKKAGLRWAGPRSKLSKGLGGRGLDEEDGLEAELQRGESTGGSGHANRGFRRGVALVTFSPMRGVVLAQKAGLEAEPTRGEVLGGSGHANEESWAWS